MANAVNAEDRECALREAQRELEKAGWKVAREAGRPVSAADLTHFLLHSRRFDGLAADAPVVFEDPKFTTPWQVKGMRVEDGRLVLDVWGRPE